MNNSNNIKNTYRYQPEPIKRGIVDWVVFTEPDSFSIERSLANGNVISCNTKITSSATRTINAWSAKDILQAISNQSIQKIRNSDIETLRLDITLDGEGKNQPFVFKWPNKTLTVLPPNDEDSQTPKGNKDLAGLVYVLTKVYRQQLMSKECEELSKTKQ